MYSIKSIRILIGVVFLMIAFQGCISFPSETQIPTSEVVITKSAQSNATDDVSIQSTILQTKPSNIKTLPPSSNVSEKTAIPTSDGSTLETPPSGWLAFVSYGEFPDSIDLIHTSGRGWRSIFSDYAHPQSPFWSPDGQWIGFINERDDNSGTDIYIMRPDGSSMGRLTNTPTYKRATSWSPDGEMIVFSQTTYGSGGMEVDIFSVDVETQIVQQLTDTPGVNEHNPVYSPDGEKIAYTSVRDGDPKNIWYLMLMDSDGSNPRMIMETPVGGGSFAWSPNGKQIVFPSADECIDLYVFSLEGGDLQQLTHAPGSETSPAWASDGSWIAFTGTDVCTSASALGWEIFFIRPDRSGLTQITNHPQRHPVDPAWSPSTGLRIGQSYAITESGDLLNLRSMPSIAGESLGKLREGEEITVLEGPIEADDYLWWYVQVVDGGGEGWVAEIPGWFVKID